MGDRIEYHFSEVERGLRKGPLSIQFEISDKCTARCITCKIREQDTGKKYVPSEDDYEQVIRTFRFAGVSHVRLTGGEPLLSKHFPFIVNHLVENKITASITTTLLTKDKENLSALLNLNSIIKVSCSAVGENFNSFYQIDNKYFDLMTENMKFLRNNKRRFSVNYTVFKDNYQKSAIRDFVDFINQFSPHYVTFFPAIGNDVERFEEKVVSNIASIKHLMKFKSNVSTIAKHFERRKIKTKVCHANKFTAHIKYNGDMYPCCMTGGEVGQKLFSNFLMGNIFHEDIRKIYRNKYEMFEDRKILNNPVCDDCTERYMITNLEYDSFLKNKKYSGMI
jgi:radical SAM protein with 4Fe4S-binding SPASM domain